MSTIVNIDDLRLLAKRRLPKIFFDYIDGGAFSETTMKRNRTDFERWELIQYVFRTTKIRASIGAILVKHRNCPLCWVPWDFSVYIEATVRFRPPKLQRTRAYHCACRLSRFRPSKRSGKKSGDNSIFNCIWTVIYRL